MLSSTVYAAMREPCGTLLLRQMCQTSSMLDTLTQVRLLPRFVVVIVMTVVVSVRTSLCVPMLSPDA